MRNQGIAAAVGTLIVVGAASAQPIGPCPIGYKIEPIPFAFGSLYFELSPDGTVVIDGRIFEAGAGEIETPEGFFPWCMNGSGLIAGIRGETIEVRTLEALVAQISLPGVFSNPRMLSMSETGWIAGFAAEPSYTAFRVSPGFEIEMLAKPHGSSAYPYAINSRGQVCGGASGAGGGSVFWDTDGELVVIPIPPEFGGTEAMDINENGDVLIHTWGVPPAIWSVEDGMRVLEPSGDNYGWSGWAMNNLGHVVGYVGPVVPWIWMGSHYSFINSALVDSDGWELATIDDINDAGQLVGHGLLNGAPTLYFAHPVGLCSADITTTGAPAGELGDGVPDGEITGTDLSFFVNHWIVGDSVADVTTQNAPAGDELYGEPDGIITGADIQYYVNMWISECGA